VANPLVTAMPLAARPACGPRVAEPLVTAIPFAGYAS